jgi:LPXTG-motif cell wall-anchored protein
MDKVVGAPTTGTADEFLEAMGLGLLVAGIALLAFLRKPQTGLL